MWMPRLSPASFPFASNVANPGSSPVRMFEFVASPASVFPFVKLQNTFTFPANVNAQPLDICIVRPCAPAVALTPNAKPNNNSVRRFIRDSLLGSLPAQSCRSCPAKRRYRAPQVQPSGNVVLPPVMLVWLLTYSCVTERKAVPTSSRERVDRAAQRPGAFPHRPAPASAQHSPLQRATACPPGWPPGTASELIPKPEGESTCRPPHGPEPRKILGTTPPCPQ